MKIKIIFISLFSLIIMSTYGQWQKINAPQYDNSFYSVCFYDESTGFLATIWDVYKTINGGLTWTIVNIPEARDRINDIHMLDENVVWLTSDDNSSAHNGGTILKSVDCGNTWEVVFDLNFFALDNLFFLDDMHVWVTSDFHRVFISDDGGENWLESDEMEMYNVSKVYFIDENTGWACGGGSDCQIYKSTDGGQSWELQFNEHDGYMMGLRDIVFFNDQKGFVCGRDRRLMATENGGETWEMIARDTIEGPLIGLPSDYAISGIEFKDQNRGWIIGGPC